MLPSQPCPLCTYKSKVPAVLTSLMDSFSLNKSPVDPSLHSKKYPSIVLKLLINFTVGSLIHRVIVGSPSIKGVNALLITISALSLALQPFLSVTSTLMFSV